MHGLGVNTFSVWISWMKTGFIASYPLPTFMLASLDVPRVALQPMQAMGSKRVRPTRSSRPADETGPVMVKQASERSPALPSRWTPTGCWIAIVAGREYELKETWSKGSGKRPNHVEFHQQPSCTGFHAVCIGSSKRHRYALYGAYAAQRRTLRSGVDQDGH